MNLANVVCKLFSVSNYLECKKQDKGQQILNYSYKNKKRCFKKKIKEAIRVCIRNTYL